MDDIIVGKRDLLSSLFRFLSNVWNVICISWYDELFFITKRFRVTVDTTCTYMYAHTLSCPFLPSLPPSLPHSLPPSLPPSLPHSHTLLELDHGLSEPQIRCIAKQMFSALGFLHESGCIHRDLKAGNILLMPNGSVRLGEWSLDFSLYLLATIYVFVVS